MLSNGNQQHMQAYNRRFGTRIAVLNRRDEEVKVILTGGIALLYDDGRYS